MRALLLAACLVLPAAFAAGQSDQPKRPDVPFVATAPAVVTGMLKLANVGSSDVVYDLGCGDGRIVIAAAKEFGAHAVGVDIDPELIRQARANARNAGVEDKVRFEENNLFNADISHATVVALYLMSGVNLRLKPRLLKELRPGARVVSHWFDMGDWKPDKRQTIAGEFVYLWTIPAREPGR